MVSKVLDAAWRKVLILVDRANARAELAPPQSSGLLYWPPECRMHGAVDTDQNDARAATKTYGVPARAQMAGSADILSYYPSGVGSQPFCMLSQIVIAAPKTGKLQPEWHAVHRHQRQAEGRKPDE